MHFLCELFRSRIIKFYVIWLKNVVFRLFAHSFRPRPPFNPIFSFSLKTHTYAESLHVSTNWFIHNFRQYMGMSPAQYVLSLRMVNAQSLLEHTNYNVKEISEIVGYDNPLYFSRVFKKEIGQSPAQYRKLRGEPAEE